VNQWITGNVPTVGLRTIRLPILENGIKPSAFAQQSVTLERIRLVCREWKEVNAQDIPDRASIGWSADDVTIKRDERTEHKAGEAEDYD